MSDGHAAHSVLVIFGNSSDIDLEASADLDVPIYRSGARRNLESTPISPALMSLWVAIFCPSKPAPGERPIYSQNL